MQFVDTNIFIRYLTKDDPLKARACYQLFQQAVTNQISLTTTEAVITEVVYILSSRKTYNLPRTAIRARLYPLLSIPGLQLPDRQTMLRALDFYVIHSVDFEDALIVARMEQQQIVDLFSYDRDFDRIPGINRLEPQLEEKR